MDNYTIAFQQSGTHFSDDLSDGSRSEQQPSQMARSELSFTTWHRLRSSGVRLQPSDGGKSQSLPNLLRRSAAVAGRGGDGCLPLYSLQVGGGGSGTTKGAPDGYRRFFSWRLDFRGCGQRKRVNACTN